MRVSLIVLVIIAPIAIPLTSPAGEKSDLVGRWVVSRLEFVNRVVRPAELERVLIDFTATKVIVSLDDEQRRASYRLGSGTGTRQIDFIPEAGPDAGRIFQGICKVVGRELRICINESTAARPTTFPSRPVGNETLIILQRAK